MEAGTRRGNGDAESHSFVERGGRRPCDGEGHGEQAQAESCGREREVPGEEGEEVKSPRTKVIRVEPEETEDCVKESLGLSREEAEEISFVPCAISVRPRPMFRCDNRCSEKNHKLLAVCFSSGDKEGWETVHNQRVPAMLQQNSGGKRR